MPAAKQKAAAEKTVRPELRSVAVVVSDRKKAADWYTRVFGLELLDEDDHWTTVGAQGSPTRIHLCQVTEFEPDGKLEPGNSGIQFHLAGKDFVAACQALKARGVQFSVEPHEEPWGWWAMVRDPDGNEHHLAPAH